VSRWAARLSGSLIVVAGTLLMSVVGIRATAWAISLFDTTLTAWWWFLLALPFGLVMGGLIGLFGSLCVADRLRERLRPVQPRAEEDR
jgi:predicted ABC-type sugar transport system permease subunit